MLLILILALVDIASPSKEVKCYGSNYEVPMYNVPPLLSSPIYYKPRVGARVLAVTQDGQSKHKRFTVRIGSIQIKVLTEQEDGAKVIFGDGEVVTLEIKDCREPEMLYYGKWLMWSIPVTAQYIEFSQVTSKGSAAKPRVVWNSSVPSQRHADFYEIPHVRQNNTGYYKAFGKEDKLLKWVKLNIKEQVRKEKILEGSNLEMGFGWELPELRHIKILSVHSDYEETYDIQDLSHRMEITDYYFSFFDLTLEDTGMYKFVDGDGYVAILLELEVLPQQVSGWVYVVGLVGLVLCIVFCVCCVKKCCCKKKSRKRNATDATEPPVFYHDPAQPTQPVRPLLSREPRAVHTDPPMYNPSVSNADPTPSVRVEVTAPGGMEPTSTGVTMTTSDSYPKFEFKGAAFPSAPPLSAGTSIQDVYTSDKLNFL